MNHHQQITQLAKIDDASRPWVFTLSNEAAQILANGGSIQDLTDAQLFAYSLVAETTVKIIIAELARRGRLRDQ